MQLLDKTNLQFIVPLALVLLLVCPAQADNSAKDVKDFIGIWMGISAGDGSFFKAVVTDNDRDGVAEVIMHDTFWSNCTQSQNLTGLEATLVPAIVSGPGTVDAEGNLDVLLTIQCRDEQNNDLGAPLGPLPVSFVAVGEHQLQLFIGADPEPSPVFRVSGVRGNDPGSGNLSDYIGLWMGISAGDGSFFKVAITDNDQNGVAEVFMHDTFWSICTEANNLSGMEATLAPAYVTGSGTVDAAGNLQVPLTIQCRDEQNADLGGPLGPLPIAYELVAENFMQLRMGQSPETSAVFRVSITGRDGEDGNYAGEIDAVFERNIRSNAAGTQPVTFDLRQNYPNPFNPSTTITYSIKETAKVSIKIYNMLGEEVATVVNEIQGPGNKSVTWNGTMDNGQPVSSGTYYYRMEAGDYTQTQQMVLAK